MCNNQQQLEDNLSQKLILIDKKKAITALGRSDRSLETSEIFGRLLANGHEPTRVRATAASGLGLLNLAASETQLLENLDTDDETVRNEIIKSLGKVGTAVSLDHLNRLTEPLNDHSRKILSFAKLLISFRIGQGRYESLSSGALAPTRWTTRSARIIEGAEVQEKIKLVWGSTYGVKLNSETAFEVDFRGPKFNILLNELVRLDAFVASIASRSMIAGVVVLEEPDVSRYSNVRYLIMTSPSERGVAVTVARTNGDIVYTGQGEFAGNDVRLMVRDTGPPVVPTEIHGQIVNDRLALSVRLSLAAARTKKHALTIAAA